MAPVDYVVQSVITVGSQVDRDKVIQVIKGKVITREFYISVDDNETCL